MKRLVALALAILLALSLTGAALADVYSDAGFIKKIPMKPKYTEEVDEHGTVEKLSYTSHAYGMEESTGKEILVEKELYVYLPFGYDPANSYNTLYVMHGAGEDERYWLSEERMGKGTLALLDRMFSRGECEPTIIITPTTNMGKLLTEDESLNGIRSDGPGNYWKELRNDVIPLIETKYSTYANGDMSQESLAASRDHRGFAGFSMGSVTTVGVMQNCLDMDVDVLFIWSVAPEAMGGVIEQARAKGIKVIAFVAPTEEYDALMVSDDAELADDCVRLAAKWIDEHFADAPDHSVPVAVFSCRTADTGVLQADEMLKVEEFSAKAKFVKEVECAEETMAVGQNAMENLYTSNPEIKVFLTPHNAFALGINSYFTGLSSPVSDYSDMAIFAVNGDNTSAEYIQDSVKNESPFRGMVLTGSVNDTANEMLMVANGLMDGSIPVGHLQKAGTVFVYADTVEEYLTTGTVLSVTSADFR